MITKAKCKLCNSIVEIKNSLDIFSCSCGEVSLDNIYGKLHASVKADIGNLMMIDDEGNQIIPKMKSNEEIGNALEPSEKPSKAQLLDMLSEMIKKMEDLPQHAFLAPVTHADYYSLLLLMESLFRSC